jgi:hypothetical protein
MNEWIASISKNVFQRLFLLQNEKLFHLASAATLAIISNLLLFLKMCVWWWANQLLSPSPLSLSFILSLSLSFSLFLFHSLSFSFILSLSLSFSLFLFHSLSFSFIISLSLSFYLSFYFILSISLSFILSLFLFHSLYLNVCLLKRDSDFSTLTKGMKITIPAISENHLRKKVLTNNRFSKKGKNCDRTMTQFCRKIH